MIFEAKVARVTKLKPTPEVGNPRSSWNNLDQTRCSVGTAVTTLLAY